MTTKTVAADVDPLALERQVCFALAITNRAVLAVYRPLLEPLGLTHPQYLVMLALWDNEKSSSPPLSVKQIAALLQMDSATLSPMPKRLQALGLITRLRSASDERTMKVELTTKGRTLRRQALKIPPAVVERLGVGLDELVHLHDVLTGINAAALAAGIHRLRDPKRPDRQRRDTGAAHALDACVPGGVRRCRAAAAAGITSFSRRCAGAGRGLGAG